MSTSTTKFDIGDCVILNHFERPWAKHICVVVGIGDGKYHVKYLNNEPEFACYNSPHIVTSLSDATLIEDFGVDLHFDHECFWCEQTRHSIATYEDGAIRRWQETYPIRVSFDPSVAKVATMPQSESAFRISKHSTKSQLDDVTRGMPIGITDINGMMICVGDTLRFDTQNWGQEKPPFFTIKIRRGEIVGLGSAYDWSNLCEIVKFAKRKK